MKIKLTLILSILSYFSIAQITVTNTTFPAAGDTLKYAISGPTDLVATNPSGANVTWNFQSLSSDIVQNFIYKNASEGQNFSNFPSADLVTFNDNADIAESYYDLTENTLSFIGYAGNDPIGLGIPIIPSYTPALYERFSPMTYLSSHNGSSNIQIPFSSAIIPDTVLSQFPLQIDSFRVKLNFDRTDNVDAWGTMKLSGANYSVLRSKRTTITNTIVEAKVQFFGWQDVSTLVSSLFPEQVFGLDTTVSYHYYNNVNKEEILFFDRSKDADVAEEATSVTFKKQNITTNLVEYTNLDFKIYPTLATNQLFYELNENVSDCSFVILNNNGQIVDNQKIDKLNLKGRIDLPKLSDGVYYIYLMNNKGANIIATNKFLVQQN